jgi:hypothetical protein
MPCARTDPLGTLSCHVTQSELSQRWRISGRTLERWRSNGTGPAWLRLNGRVLYRVKDVLAFEHLRLRRK